jgi:hypothetical protein
MDLRRLRYFVVAAEESNFRRASLRLRTNPSIISRHVRDAPGAKSATPGVRSSVLKWRREWDSNPRTLAGLRFSRPVH